MVLRVLHSLLRRLRAGVGVVAVLLMVAASGASSTLTSAPLVASTSVGPWFGNDLSQPHGCVGVVVHSAVHDTVLTAAHCAIAAGMLFAPGYNEGATPYGVWRVEKSFVDSRWAATQDPDHDFAVLDMAPQRRAGKTMNIEDVTRAIPLGTTPPAGQHAIVYAYPFGINDQPVRCAVTVYIDNGYPAFDCHGFTPGTSGGPWILPATRSAPAQVVGVIGGYQTGGLSEDTSYTSHFGRDVASVLAQASAA